MVGCEKLYYIHVHLPTPSFIPNFSLSEPFSLDRVEKPSNIEMMIVSISIQHDPVYYYMIFFIELTAVVIELGPIFA